MTRPSSVKVRRACFEAHRWVDPVSGRIMLTCHICGLPIDPAREPWDAEHTSPHANGGRDVRPAHVACHKVKTADDVGKIAKGKRVRDKHYNIVRKQGFRKTPEGYKYSWKAGRLMKVGEDVE